MTSSLTIFDFDGTLVDTMLAIQVAAKKVTNVIKGNTTLIDNAYIIDQKLVKSYGYAKYDLWKLAFAWWSYIRTRDLQDCINETIEFFKVKRNLPKEVANIKSILEECLLAPPIYTEVPKVLKELSESCTLALITEGILSLQRKRLNLFPYISLFQAVRVTDMKNPLIFEEVIRNCSKRVGSSFSKIYVIGDNADGEISIGNKLRAITVIVQREQSQKQASNTAPKYIVQDLTGILRIIQCKICPEYQAP